KIHQAMQRAEKEGCAAGITPPSSTPLKGWKRKWLKTRTAPSGARKRVQGAIAGRESSLSSATQDLAIPGNERIPAGSVSDFSVVVERKITPDSRLVALSSRTYDGLRDGLRAAKANARAGGNDLKAILFTSVGVGDGKSLNTANVSISISKDLGERVLLVDANLRAPSIHRLLGIGQESGLSDVLQGTAAANQAISRTDISNFYVVTAGSRVENPTELLNTRKMSDFLALAKKHFDWVFLDSPSLMPEPDTDLLSSMVDAVVLVTRSAQSSAGPLRDGIQMLQGRNVLGMVLNDVDARNVPLRALQR
ncbi:MAG TPA: CpsD/CapB family tyrosine-protein kinase, partial [Terriglobia bacterium]|nr:CpsD/CapB family tyrosine-protein kinase [Terriglobia bacterium]